MSYDPYNYKAVSTGQSSLKKASLKKASLKKASLEKAYMEESYTEESDMEEASVEKAPVEQHSSVSIGAIPSIQPKLAGVCNYASWKFIMRMTLIAFDLLDCIESTNPSELDKKRVQKAMLCICLNIEEQCYEHVTDATTAIEAWKNLRLAYENKGVPKVVDLMRSFLEIKYDNFDDADQYISEAISRSQALRDIGHPIEDKLLAIIILANLPAKFKPSIEEINMKLNGCSTSITTKLIKEKFSPPLTKVNTIPIEPSQDTEK